jgi:nucleotide-binding universal stress UspA family protein
VAVEWVLRRGAAWSEINAAVKDTGADLVVMGTHGRRGVARALLGSVAEKVVRSASCPVLTVHGAADER